ncbi:MAG: ATP-binding protein [Myxococcales bacterium]|nr:ATP-binding protein [Myxococcales bacterium]
MPTRGRLRLVIGPVGAGKSTFSRQLCAEHHALALNLDAWMARLYGADERPAEGRVAWYLERRDRCLAQLWDVAREVLALGVDVALEPGLVARRERAAFYDQVDEAGVELTVYVLDAPRELRRARVLQRNRERGGTFAMEVPMQFFELASDLWEPPDDAEQRARAPVTVVDVTRPPGPPAWIYARAP